MRFIRCFAAPLATLVIALTSSSCSSCGTATATTTPGTTGDTSYVAAYKALTWGSTATVTFPRECTMYISTTGVPPYHNDYYLAPTSTQYPTTAVYSPGSGTAYSVAPYTPSAITAAYHYVLPIGVTSYAASMQCLTGTVSTTTLAEAQRIQCNMKAFKSGKGLQRPQPAKKQEPMVGMAM